MAAIEKRIEKLEAEDGKKPLKFLWHEPGESREDCMKRHGYKPDDKTATFVMAGWLDREI